MMKYQSVKDSIFIAIFGGAGCVLRHRIDSLIPTASGGFPWSTFSINLLGSFLIGVLAGLPAERLPADFRIFLTVGFLGGFTTFSSFSLQLVQLLREGSSESLKIFALYLCASLLLGLTCAWLGIQLSRTFLAQN